MQRKLIQFVRDLRRRKNTDKHKYDGYYAFVGAGNHSTVNLYPALQSLGIKVRYVVTKSSRNDQVSHTIAPGAEWTTNLNKIIDDESLKGVFVCTNPGDHFQLVKKLLIARKNVFVEKPPCADLVELFELRQLQRSSGKLCEVGLQKRHTPAIKRLKSLCSKPSNYMLRFLVGAYPEGDPLTELFIHPIDLIHFLFGPVEHFSIQSTTSGETILLQVRHISQTIGAIEVSTEYSWAKPVEELIINTEKGVFKLTDSATLTLQSKPRRLAGLPLEKILDHRPIEQTLVEPLRAIPTLQNSSLYASGYLAEVKNFIDQCEGKATHPSVTLDTLTSTYLILNEIKDHVQKKRLSQTRI